MTPFKLGRRAAILPSPLPARCASEGREPGALKLGIGLLQLGAAGVGAGVLAIPLLYTAALLWLSAVGAALAVVGLVVLIVAPP